MTREEYIAELRRRHRLRVRRFLYALLLWGCSLVATFAIEKSVGLRLVPLPVSVGEYIHKTLPFSFSFQTLRTLVETSGGNIGHLILAIGLYGAFYFFFLFWFIGALLFLLAALVVLPSLFLLRPIVGVRIPDLGLRYYGRGLIATNELRKGLDEYITSTSRASGRRFKRAARRSQFHFLVSPVKPYWHGIATMQWFGSIALPREVRSIVSTLGGFHRALHAVKLTNSKSELVPLREPLHLLEDFFFTVAARVDPLLRLDGPISQPRTPEQEIRILMEFARRVRPWILTTLRKREATATAFSRLGSGFERLYTSPIVRTALLVSSIAAVVMIVGVLLFRIDPPQAFLTWFAVTFGSLTVSVGVTYFRVVSGRDNQKTEGS